MCRSIIRGNSLDIAIENALKHVSEDDIKTAYNYDVKYEELSKDGYAPNVLQSTLYFVKNNNNFNDTLEESLIFAGSENYCPVLVGILAGAMYGYTDISSDMCSHIDYRLEAQFKFIENQLLATWDLMN
eukprot:TRINITY_DN2740_c0_g1_i2.p1 TRINITY_DN2740_c0_g1~~TRINITY_DN2740_c0_g1_i2.p1  ORF type:complete len:129 (-),score=28.40 TRINITY_DN2740_c0_g1_i2:65-451(-)